MFSKLLILFIGVPLVEMLILIKLGEVLGFWSTIGLVIVTGFLGALLARIQGFRAWLTVQSEVQRGGLPGESMIEALLILIAGIVLLTPGLLTDILGFLLLIPFTRKAFISFAKKRFEKMQENSQGAYRVYDYKEIHDEES